MVLFSKKYKYPVFLLCFLPVMLALAACSNLGYYWQSATGHLGIMAKRQDIADILREDEISENLRTKLSLVGEIRKFASQDMLLPDNDSYSQYVDIERNYVVWNVFAAPEFSLELKKWCFLFVGCVGYRGYYDKADAETFANSIQKEENLEIHVGGAKAYSTLGWFDDPVLNTFINYPEANLAGLIFHELAHQLLYIKNDAAFNEGFATTVEIEGVKRWIAAHPDSGDAARYGRQKRVRNEFVELLKETHKQLRELYQTSMPDQQKRIEKAKIIEALKQRYQHRREQVEDLRVYDKWFSKPINNARLGAVSTYEDYVPAFQQLLRESQGDLSGFYESVRKISELDKEQRQVRLAKLASLQEQ